MVVGLLVTAGLAPVVRKQMLHHEFLDVPNARSSHTIPTPRAGGLAVLGGILAAAACGWLVGHPVPWAPLGGALVLSLIGLRDDQASLSPSWRLLAQALVGGLVGFAVGGAWICLVGLVLFPLFVNAVNFMDGINGITGLTMVIWGASVLAVGLRSDADALVGLGGLTVGAALGFLPFNAPHARLFLGDVGSYLFGALVAGGVLVGGQLNTPIGPLLAPLAIYAADTAWTFARRLARGERLLDAHREHVYQQLTNCAGRSHTCVAGFVAALAAIASLAWWTMPAWAAGTATVLVCIVYLQSPRQLARWPVKGGEQ